MEKAAFKLTDYAFPTTVVDYNYFLEGEMDISFKVSGEYMSADNKFLLKFETKASIEKSGGNFIKVDCEGVFDFQNVNDFGQIPDFFYNNCIAILFPYVRAYISTVTVQSNIKPVILPTLNLMPLAQQLREYSKPID